MISMSDFGIVAEIIGFVLLLLVGNRNPTSGHLVLNSHKEDIFDIIRKKMIPDKLVHFVLIISIVIVVIGLIFQLSYFNPPTIINT